MRVASPDSTTANQNLRGVGEMLHKIATTQAARLNSHRTAAIPAIT